MPKIGSSDAFERRYLTKFKALVAEFGLLLKYEDDRATLDLGLHLTAPSESGEKVLLTRIWFQCKGLLAETMTLEAFHSADRVPIRVEVEHLRFWYASPEPIYLAVFVEAAGVFLVEDVRELIDNHPSLDLRAFEASSKQQSMTVYLRKESTLTASRIEAMRRQQSLRITGPFFRGRPLGHRLDPLRCQLEPLGSEEFAAVVRRILQLHTFRHQDDAGGVVPASMVPGLSFDCGRLYNTLEWVPQLFTEFGVGRDDDFRIEGRPEFAQGPVGIAILSGPANSEREAEEIERFCDFLSSYDVERVLVFANTDDISYVGLAARASRRTVRVRCSPILLPELAYLLLTATVAYMECREALRWRYVNYLWDS